jgi:hypothetical protein
MRPIRSFTTLMLLFVGVGCSQEAPSPTVQGEPFVGKCSINRSLPC